jgi:hypothetical protein
MGTLFYFLAAIILLTGIVTLLFYKYKPKFLWFVPVAAVIVSGCLLLKDISIITSEPTFAEKLGLYFHNDWSMGFYLVYMPITVIAVIMTVIAYLINHYKRKPDKKV